MPGHMRVCLYATGKRLRPGVTWVVLLSLSACAVVAESSTTHLEPTGASAAILQPPTGRFFKRIVAIERFSNETTYGKSPLLGGDVLGRQASDILAARLASTEKFLLLEESETSGLAAADFRLIGSVSEFGRKTSSETGVFSKTKTQVAQAAVNLRIVDVRSGFVIFSTEGRGEASSTTGKVLGAGTAQGFDSTLSERAISAAISSVISNTVERMLDAPWRSHVLDVEGDSIIIGGGTSQGLAVGDRLQIVEPGRTITNPQTKTSIQIDGKAIATIEITECKGSGYTTEYSVCRLVSGELPQDRTKVTVREPVDQ